MTDLSGNVGWTPLSKVPFNHYEGEPGQTFSEDQLPHPEVQRAAGINPDLYRAQHGLYVTPAAGPTAQPVGTETGLSPAEALRKTGNVESFVFVVAEPVEALAEPSDTVPAPEAQSPDVVPEESETVSE